MDKIKESITKLKEKNNFITIIMIVGIIGISLIFVSSFLGGQEEKNTSTNTVSITKYCQSLQEDVSGIVRSIDGAGNVKVLITMENSTEIVYTDDEKEKTKEVQPVIRGVVVVCDGGENAIVHNRILGAVTKSLGISSNKVCITKLKSEEN